MADDNAPSPQVNPHGPASLFPDTWTVKEVVADMKADLGEHLTRQDDMLIEINRKVDSKADKADLVAVAHRVDRLGGRVSTLEEHRADAESTKRFRNRFWAVVGTAGGIAAIIVGALVDSHVH